MYWCDLMFAGKPLPPKKKTSAPPPVQCIHEDKMYSPFHILPPSSRHPCTYQYVPCPKRKPLGGKFMLALCERFIHPIDSIL